MPVEVRVPAFGESIVEATIGRWLKSDGDKVAYGDPLVELETDKVNVEITAEQDGVLQNIAHKEGETVNVGDVLAFLGETNGTTAKPVAETAAPSVAAVNGKAPVEEDDAAITPIAKRLAEEN